MSGKPHPPLCPGTPLVFVSNMTKTGVFHFNEDGEEILSSFEPDERAFIARYVR